MGFLDVKEELMEVAYDPNQVQIELYKNMENLLEGNDIPDPSNPFMFLLESNATIGSVLLEKMKNNLRKLYPVLANTREDLYHHIYDREIENIFAYPSSGSFTISIPVNQIVNYGNKNDNHYEVTIPMFTKIIVKNYYTFMVLNDIVIKYYPNNNKSLVMYMPSELSISYIGNELLTSFIVTDNNNLDWLVFNVNLKQIDGFYIKEPIIPIEGYNKDIEFKDQFYTLYSRVYSNTLGYVDLKPVFSDFVYDVKNPILKCKLKTDTTLNISMYDLYLENTDFNSIETLIFTTKGNLSTNFTSVSKDEFAMDFSLVKDINNNLTNLLNINPVIYSTGNINGGKDMLTIDELKQIIINNTTGDNNLPITKYDLKERVNRLGYEFNEDIDSLLKRQYTITKPLSFSKENFIYSNPDIFLDTLSILPEDVVNLPDKIKLTENSLIIEPYVFFYKDNYVFKPVKQEYVDKIKSSSLEDIKYLITDKKYFYNIYKYVCDFKDTVDYRIYEVNTPKVNYIKSTFYNKGLDIKILYKDKVIIKNNNNYTFRLYLDIDDNAINLINDEKIKAIFKFKPDLNSSYIVLEGVFDTVNKYLDFVFELDSYIDTEDKVKLLNSNLDVTIIPNEIEGNVYIYTTDNSYINKDVYEINNVLTYDTSVTAVILTYNVKINFYNRLRYLYSNYKLSPTLRQYKRYEEDVYLTYEEDIYAKDENGNYILEDVEYNGVTVKRVKILHSRGDIVYDDNGNPLIKYKAGDVILDENGRPIVDYVNGYEHYIDILTFELEFLLVNDSNYKDFMVSKYLELNTLLLTELKELNSNLLENTKILYKPKYNLRDVKVYVNNVIYTTPSLIKPLITLYLLEEITDQITYNNLIRKLNILLQEAFIKYNNKIDIVNHIVNNIDYSNLQYLKIDNIDNIDNLTVFNFTNDSNRFTINKKIDYNESSILIPQIDFDLKIVKI